MIECFAVYKGRILSVRKELMHVYLFYNKTIADGKERYFSTKWDRKTKIGQIFKVQLEVRDEGLDLVSVKDATYVGYHTEYSDIVRWSGKDAAVEGEYREIKEKDSLRNKDYFKEALAPIRLAYRGATRQGRLSILAAVIDEITKG